MEKTRVREGVKAALEEVLEEKMAEHLPPTTRPAGATRPKPSQRQGGGGCRGLEEFEKRPRPPQKARRRRLRRAFGERGEDATTLGESLAGRLRRCGAPPGQDSRGAGPAKSSIQEIKPAAALILKAPPLPDRR